MSLCTMSRATELVASSSCMLSARSWFSAASRGFEKRMVVQIESKMLSRSAIKAICMV